MKVKISKRFVKDTNKITDQRILAKIRQIIVETSAIESLAELENLIELSGYPNYYCIKFDYHYRIGAYFDGEAIEFLRVGNTGKIFTKNSPDSPLKPTNKRR